MVYRNSLKKKKFLTMMILLRIVYELKSNRQDTLVNLLLKLFTFEDCNLLLLMKPYGIINEIEAG